MRVDLTIVCVIHIVYSCVCVCVCAHAQIDSMWREALNRRIILKCSKNSFQIHTKLKQCLYMFFEQNFHARQWLGRGICINVHLIIFSTNIFELKLVIARVSVCSKGCLFTQKLKQLRLVTVSKLILSSSATLALKVFIFDFKILLGNIWQELDILAFLACKCY